MDWGLLEAGKIFQNRVCLDVASEYGYHQSSYAISGQEQSFLVEAPGCFGSCTTRTHSVISASRGRARTGLAALDGDLLSGTMCQTEKSFSDPPQPHMQLKTKIGMPVEWLSSLQFYLLKYSFEALACTNKVYVVHISTDDVKYKMQFFLNILITVIFAFIIIFSFIIIWNILIIVK